MSYFFLLPIIFCRSECYDDHVEKILLQNGMIAMSGADDAASETESDIALGSSDYEMVARVIDCIGTHSSFQPTLEEIAIYVGLSPCYLHHLFSRWAGTNLKSFLHSLTMDHARHLLRSRASVLDAACEVGLPGPGWPHDLFVSFVKMLPNDANSKEVGFEMTYGFHVSPFGMCLALSIDRGLAGLAFADGVTNKSSVLDDMKRRWPNACFIEDPRRTKVYVERIFVARGTPRQTINIVLIGTNFDVSVWQALLRIPKGFATSYSDIARYIGKPKAVRAVGSAVGRNPLSFVVPCHRVLRKSGELGGYHWRLVRKQAIIGWEAASLDS